MPNIDVNGQTIDYPDIGDPNWGDNATNFAIQTSAALGKIGLSSGTSVDITYLFFCLLVFLLAF